MESYKELIVYKKAYQLVLEIYKSTEKFPDVEKYGLSSQLRRAAFSIPSNISEGYCRKSRKEYIQFLSIAFGSCSEIETQISIANDLGMFKNGEYQSLSSLQTEVSKMLFVLIKSLSDKD